jgi:HPt (histidine-containing phosphotransfer) domain-containing protein
MAKKDADTADRLDGRAKDRLEKLRRDWESDSPYFPEKLTPADLRLMLEHFEPLRKLIRKIAAGHSAAPAASHADDADLDTLREELAQALAAQEELRRELDEALAAQEALRSERDAAKRDIQQLQKRCRTLETELAESRREVDSLRQRRNEHPVLAILRRDGELAARLGLGALDGAEPEPLIRAVAVLAQRDTLQRLWDRLKERCEKERRPANADERLLLETALAWHNHNWPSKPYQLVAPQPGSAYDFNSHQRATATASGERIAAVWLPGIADGSGRVQQKPLVTTQ